MAEQVNKSSRIKMSVILILKSCPRELQLGSTVLLRVRVCSHTYYGVIQVLSLNILIRRCGNNRNDNNDEDR